MAVLLSRLLAAFSVVIRRDGACAPMLHRHRMVLQGLGALSLRPSRKTCMLTGQLHSFKQGAGLQDLCKAEEGQRGLPAHVGSMEVDGAPSGLPAGEAKLLSLHAAVCFSQWWPALLSRWTQQSACPCNLPLVL